MNRDKSCDVRACMWSMWIQWLYSTHTCMYICAYRCVYVHISEFICMYIVCGLVCASAHLFARVMNILFIVWHGKRVTSAVQTSSQGSFLGKKCGAQAGRNTILKISVSTVLPSRSHSDHFSVSPSPPCLELAKHLPDFSKVSSGWFN